MAAETETEPDLVKVFPLAQELQVVLTPEEVFMATRKLGQRAVEIIDSGVNPLFLINLDGAMPVGVDVLRYIAKHRPDAHPDFTTVQTRSYDQGNEQAKVRLVKPIDEDIDVEGRVTPLIEDVIDNGLSFEAVKAHSTERGAIAVPGLILIRKKLDPEVVLPEDVEVGIEVDPYFIVGAGTQTSVGYRQAFRFQEHVSAYEPILMTREQAEADGRLILPDEDE